MTEALPATTKVPADWRAAAGNEPVQDDWLKSLDDPVLEKLVEEAIENNTDLRQAAERVRIAQQSVVVAGAPLLPQINAELGGRTTRDEGRDDNVNSATLFGGLSWELDLWGKLRSQNAAAQAAFEATEQDYVMARMSLAATVAKAWYLTCEARQMVELADKSVHVYRELLTLVQQRREAGKDTDLNVYEVRAKLESALSDQQTANQSYGQAQRALETLLGRYPAAEIEGAAAYATLVPAPSTGNPQALLTRRPDVLAAERAVLAAFRNEEAAELSLLPGVSVSLGGGLLDDQVLSLLDLNPWMASAGIGVTIPLYDGGALRAQVKIATAQQAQAVARFGSVVLTSFREVENALANELLLAKRLPHEQNAYHGRTEVVRIATEQYRAGQRDLLWVSNLQAAQLATEGELIALRGLQRINRIQLLLALGGDFDQPPAAESLTASEPEPNR